MARRKRLLGPDTDLVVYLKLLPPELRSEAVELLSPEERMALDDEWPEWAHQGQLAPSGTWRTWVIMAGRGFGKTRAGAEWITSVVRYGTDLSIALVAATIDEAREIMVEGRSGLLRVAEPWVTNWVPSRLTIEFRGGSQAHLFSGCNPDGLRGPEHHIAWCDELAKWEKGEESWAMLQLGLRLGDRPRAIVTTTPRPGPVLTRIMAEPGCEVSGGPTYWNPHLPRTFVETVQALYGGTRLGEQEIEGKLITDKPGALWTVETLEACRVGSALEDRLERIAVGVDPPAADGTCGIVVCGRDQDGVGHVLADHSVTGVSPEAWAGKVTATAEIYRDRAARPPLVVAESNQGGEMVESVLHAAGSELTVKLVRATVGKSARAEPVGLLFEAGKIVVHGRFPQLEAQLLGMIAGSGYDGPGRSPDRADAMVWALTELMLRPVPAEPRVRSV